MSVLQTLIHMRCSKSKTDLLIIVMPTQVTYYK